LAANRSPSIQNPAQAVAQDQAPDPVARRRTGPAHVQGARVLRARVEQARILEAPVPVHALALVRVVHASVGRSPAASVLADRQGKSAAKGATRLTIIRKKAE
jgi:hypothetical protein